MPKLTTLERALRAVPYEKPDWVLCARFPTPLGGYVYVSDGGGMVRFVGTCPAPQKTFPNFATVTRYFDETTGVATSLDPREVTIDVEAAMRHWRVVGEPELKAWKHLRRDSGRAAVARAKAWWEENKDEMHHVRADKPRAYVEKGRGSAPDVPRIREAAEATFVREHPQPDELPLVKLGDREFNAQRLARLVRLVKPTRTTLRIDGGRIWVQLFGATYDAVLMAIIKGDD